MNALRIWGELLDFETMTLPEIQAAIDTFRGRGGAQNYQRTVLHELKRFIAWLVKKKIRDLPLEEIKEIRLPRVNKMAVRASDLLSVEQVGELIGCCRSSRDRALVLITYLGGMRPVEVLGLTWGDLRVDDQGIILNTQEKTGVPRFVRLPGATVKNYMAQWRADAKGMGAGMNNGDPIFTSLRPPFKKLQDNSLKMIFRRMSEGKIHPYLLRHSRITQMILDGVPESAIKMQMWGTLQTPMLQTYTHLTGQQSDNMILEAYGMQKTERKTATLEAPTCPRCFQEVSAAAEFCMRCGTPLTEQAQQMVEKKTAEKVGEDRYKEIEERIFKRLSRKLEK